VSNYPRLDQLAAELGYSEVAPQGATSPQPDQVNYERIFMVQTRWSKQPFGLRLNLSLRLAGDQIEGVLIAHYGAIQLRTGPFTMDGDFRFSQVEKQMYDALGDLYHLPSTFRKHKHQTGDPFDFPARLQKARETIEKISQIGDVERPVDPTACQLIDIANAWLGDDRAIEDKLTGR